jgi:diacylglycerol kinase family enzyme
VFDPNIESDDGLFELVPVTGRRDFGAKLIGGLRHSPVGTDELSLLGFAHEKPITGARFELDVRARPLPSAQCDGEELPAGDRYRIEVMPRALRLIVPREHIDPANVDASGRWQKA